MPKISVTIPIEIHVPLWADRKAVSNACTKKLDSGQQLRMEARAFNGEIESMTLEIPAYALTQVYAGINQYFDITEKEQAEKQRLQENSNLIPLYALAKSVGLGRATMYRRLNKYAPRKQKKLIRHGKKVTAVSPDTAMLILADYPHMQAQSIVDRARQFDT